MMSKTILFLFVLGLGISPGSVEEHYITATPCHEDLRKIHKIPAGVDCSVINWDLLLKSEGENNQFLLKSDWGFYVDNRTLEKRGSAESSGSWTAELTDDINRVTLVSENGIKISFRKLDANHLHALDSKGNLARGNDGYSYTLNKSNPIESERKNTVDKSRTLTAGSFTKTIFAGRTPCQDIAKQVNIDVDPDCFKLKWKLTLYQDSISHLPTSYELSRTYHRSSLLKGIWKVYPAMINNRKEIVFQLDPDKPETSVSFMKGDDNLLFFLDRNLNLMVGGKEFGYTLNRR